jgi:hypothetical protein
METIKNNWIILVAAVLVWRWKVAESAGVPVMYAIENITKITSAEVRSKWQAEHPAVVIPLPGATVTIDGQGVSVL